MQLNLKLVTGLIGLNSWEAVSQVGLRFLQFHDVASISMEVGHADRASCPAVVFDSEISSIHRLGLSFDRVTTATCFVHVAVYTAVGLGHVVPLPGSRPLHV